MVEKTIIDAVLVVSIGGYSLAEMNQYLTSGGLVIAVIIGVLRICLLIREWREKRK